jgi:hypothetical protein
LNVFFYIRRYRERKRKIEEKRGVKVRTSVKRTSSPTGRVPLHRG